MRKLATWGSYKKKPLRSKLKKTQIGSAAQQKAAGKKTTTPAAYSWTAAQGKAARQKSFDYVAEGQKKLAARTPAAKPNLWSRVKKGVGIKPFWKGLDKPMAAKEGAVGKSLAKGFGLSPKTGERIELAAQTLMFPPLTATGAAGKGVKPLQTAIKEGGFGVGKAAKLGGRDYLSKWPTALREMIEKGGAEGRAAMKAGEAVYGKQAIGGIPKGAKLGWGRTLSPKALKAIDEGRTSFEKFKIKTEKLGEKILTQDIPERVALSSAGKGGGLKQSIRKSLKGQMFMEKTGRRFTGINPKMARLAQSFLAKTWEVAKHPKFIMGMAGSLIAGAWGQSEGLLNMAFSRDAAVKLEDYELAADIDEIATEAADNMWVLGIPGFGAYKGIKNYIKSYYTKKAVTDRLLEKQLAGETDYTGRTIKETQEAGQAHDIKMHGLYEESRETGRQHDIDMQNLRAQYLEDKIANDEATAEYYRGSEEIKQMNAEQQQEFWRDYQQRKFEYWAAWQKKKEEERPSKLGFGLL